MPNNNGDRDDDYGHYAEIDVVTTNDYYYITNLNQYYDEQQHLNNSNKSYHHQHHQQQQHHRRDSSSSSSWSTYTYNNHNKYQSTNRSTSVFTQCHNSKMDKSRYYHHQMNAIVNSGAEDGSVSMKTTNNILRNTQKRCRRKLFALNFMLKNLITYRFKYDIL